MNNALKVYLRDLRRFARVPQAVIILVGIIIIPSLYAWFNIVAFWDPYSNTQDVKVAVVNLDEGAYSDLTGRVDVGEQVVAQLKQNNQLGWVFLDKEEAMTAVKSGDAYAAIVLPEHFSRDLLSVTTGDFVRPKLEYFVNEKANAIAPKITDVGATTLETQINSTFVSTVSETLTTALEQAGVDIESRLEQAQEGSVNVLRQVSSQVAAAREGLSSIDDAVLSGATAVGDARSALQEADSALNGAQDAIRETQALVADVQTGMISFTHSLTHASISGTAKLTEISAKLNHQLASLSAGMDQASSVVGTAINDATAVVEANGRALAELQDVLSTLAPTDPQYQAISDAINRLQTQNTADQQLLGELQQLNSDVAQLSTELQASASAMNSAIQSTATAAGAVGSVLQGTVPRLNQALSTLSAAAGGFAASLDAQKVLIGEAVQLLESLEGVFEQASASTESLDANLASLQQDLTGLRADVSAVTSADLWNQVQVLTSLDPKKISEFMASPVKVNDKVVFPVTTYGSAMAPLFTNLSLWIAAFVLVVLLKLEVDTEGIKGLTVRQAYLGRWMLLATINFFQALLVSVGNVVIGVQMASAVAYVLTSVFVGFVYMAIIYSLAMSFGYVGKGMAILLVIMQIPGASGIYPIEMMPDFFRALFPFFPFTYGIDAMRETIGGFYHGDYWLSFAVLVLYALLAFALGLYFRQRLGNFARLFNSKLSETGLFVSENVQVLGARRRVTQILQALTNREKFRKATARQALWFDKRHLTVLRLALLVGVVLTAVLLVIAWLIPDAKATILGLWGILCFVIIGFVVMLEYLKQNVTFAKKVGDLPAPELQTRLEQEEQATHSDAVLDELRERV